MIRPGLPIGLATLALCAPIFAQNAPKPPPRLPAPAQTPASVGAPTTADEFFQRGEAALRSGQVSQRAIADFSDAIRLDPKFADAYNRRGVAYLLLRRPDLAIEDHTEAIKLKPDNPDGYFGRAGAYLARGDHANVIADYTQALRLQPDDADPRRINALLWRGRAYFFTEKYDEAVADYTRVIGLNPNYANSFFGYGGLFAIRAQAYARKGDYATAIADFDEAIRRGAALDVLYDRGLAHKANGDRDRAAADFRAVISKFAATRYADGDGESAQSDRAVAADARRQLANLGVQ
jgi:tetratricopeptide (TPR) repeat protein